jgi:hypothetical protein
MKMTISKVRKNINLVNTGLISLFGGQNRMDSAWKPWKIREEYSSWGYNAQQEFQIVYLIFNRTFLHGIANR